MRVQPIAELAARSGTFLAIGLLGTSLATAATFKARPCEVPGVQEAILQHVNAVRAKGYRCGGQGHAATRPVAWNGQLQAAAAGHSQDMAEQNYFAHQSLRGTQAAQRADAAGYKWRSVGENIAAGDTSVPSVVRGWLDSAEHCRNIMDPAYTEIAVACMARPGTTYGTYWTMVLGRR